MSLICTQSKDAVARWCIDYARREAALEERIEAALTAVAVPNEPHPVKVC